jgi:hypothetical protein
MLQFLATLLKCLSILGETGVKVAVRRCFAAKIASSNSGSGNLVNLLLVLLCHATSASSKTEDSSQYPLDVELVWVTCLRHSGHV